MEAHPLSALLQDLAQLLARTGLRLQHLSDQYQSSKQRRLSKPQQSIHSDDLTFQQSHLLQQHLELDAPMTLNQESLKKSVFGLYFKHHRSRIQEQNPQLSGSLVLAWAENEFRGLRQAERMQYLRMFFKEDRQQQPGLHLADSSDVYGYDLLKGQSHHEYLLSDPSVKIPSRSSFYNEPFGMVSLFDHQDDIRRYDSSLLPNGLGQLSGKDVAMLEQFKKENVEGPDNQNRGNNMHSSAKGEREEGRGKGDVYKMALSHKGGQKPSKSGAREEQSKDKSEFQTLKSLFKKLQNTS